MDLVVDVYELSRDFPPAEAYRLTSQVTRAVVSVPANIAEGKALAGVRDYAKFLSIGRGSLMESETLLTVAVLLVYLTDARASPAFGLITEISKMITVLRNRVADSG